MISSTEVETKSLRGRAVQRGFVGEVNLELSVNLGNAYYVLSIDGIKLSKTGPLPLWYGKHINRAFEYNAVSSLISIYGTPTRCQALKLWQ